MNIYKPLEIHEAHFGRVVPQTLQFLKETLEDHFLRGEKVLLLLSGGSTVQLYRPLSEWIASQSYKIKMAVAQIDERFKPEIREEVNAERIINTGLPPILAQRQIKTLFISQRGKLKKAARLYDGKIEKLFNRYPVRIGILGIGPDGHTAGLLPGYARSWDTGNLVEGYRNKGEFRVRITLTPAALMELTQAVVFVTGTEKKPVLKQLIDPNDTTTLNTFPAGILAMIPETHVFTDIPVLPLVKQVPYGKIWATLQLFTGILAAYLVAGFVLVNIMQVTGHTGVENIFLLTLHTIERNIADENFWRALVTWPLFLIGVMLEI